MALNFSISSILNNSSSSRSAVNNPVKTEIITSDNSSSFPEGHSSNLSPPASCSYQTFLTALNWQAYGYLSNFAVQAAVANSNQESGSQETSPNSSFHTLPQMSPPQTPLSQSNNGQPQQPVIMPPHWSQKQQGHETGVLRRRYTTEQNKCTHGEIQEITLCATTGNGRIGLCYGTDHVTSLKFGFKNRRLKDRKKMQKSRSQSPELEV
ncbi:unnamed protein product [Lepeophtheirus salmonis]|uniref:(salmon louse) hypothetical protein n=1 Tax=Lepeophtheirus salmonis TaxID=72036 RepID=A0A7R8H9J6_LEPSM|nr:unnamed protein product [Lepeophtheirus salmonis]CAF2956932.1 unnamed protein product [Lepeophtheirus salmonis]